jgi:hypothetical protein
VTRGAVINLATAGLLALMGLLCRWLPDPIRRWRSLVWAPSAREAFRVLGALLLVGAFTLAVVALL